MVTMAQLRPHLFFKKAVPMQVFHPEKGAMKLEAYSEVDAKLRAALDWDICFAEEAPRMRIAVHQKALKKLAQELGLI